MQTYLEKAYYNDRYTAVKFRAILILLYNHWPSKGGTLSAQYYFHFPFEKAYILWSMSWVVSRHLY